MQKRPRILVTDGDFKHTLGAVRHLARDGFSVDAIGPHRCIAGWSRHIGQVHDLNSFCAERFDEFLQFLAQQRYDVLLPISSNAVELTACRKADVERHCRTPVADHEKVELCFDKARINTFAAELGVGAPTTWHASSVDDLKAMLPDIRFPVVLKRLSELGSFATTYAQDDKEMFRTLAPWMNGQVIDEPLPVIQPRIIGPGEGFFALYDHGVCKRIFMHRRVRETPPSGGASCCAVSVFEEDLKQAGMKLLDRLQWHGVAMAEFKRDARTGQLYLLEINPKFWGSLDLALDSGVNFPAWACRMALGEDIGYSESYRVGQKFHWPLNGEFKHIAARPRSIWPFLADVANPFVHSNISLRDPMPAAYSIFRQGAAAFSAIGRRLGVSRP